MARTRDFSRVSGAGRDATEAQTRRVVSMKSETPREGASRGVARLGKQTGAASYSRPDPGVPYPYWSL